MKLNNRIALMMAVMMVIMIPFTGIVGAQTDDTTSEDTPFLGIGFEESEIGVEIVQVVSGSPANDAGIVVGDVLTAINGENVDFDTVADVVAGFAVGDVVTVDVLRDGETVSIEVTLGERPDTPTPPNRRNDPPRLAFERSFDGAFLGVVIESSDEGVIIVEVQPDSPAAEAGLQRGDVVTGINDTEITDTQLLVETVQALDAGDTINLNILRDGESMTLDATLGERPVMRSMVIDGLPFDSELDIAYLAEENVWFINALSDDGALADAGFEAGDRITAINGEAYSPQDLPRLLTNLDPETPVAVTVERGEETVELEVELPALLPIISGLRMNGNLGEGFRFNMPQHGDRRDNRDGNRFFEDRLPTIGNRARLGVTFVMLDEVTAVEYELEEISGALIVEVSPNSPADQAGVQANDIVTAVDGDTVDVQRNLAERISAYDQGDAVSLSIIRDGEAQAIDVILGGAPLRGFNSGLGDGFGLRDLFPFDIDIEEIIPPVEESDI